MRGKTWLLVAAAAAVTASGPAAHADPLDTPALSSYLTVTFTQTTENLARGMSVRDNLTCDPAPVVDGRMLAPRAPIVVGEVYAHVEIAGHLKCASLDTNASYWVHAVVRDHYWDHGVYRVGGSAWDFRTSEGGAATVNPVAVLQYEAGHGALNTWHYAEFEGWTSTGRHITGVSPAFYVAAV